MSTSKATLLERVKAGTVIPEIEAVAHNESVPETLIIEGLLEGTIVIPANPRHKNLKPVGVGKGLRTKVSASIGLGYEGASIQEELAKIDEALDAGTDAIMDLSVCGDIDGMRKAALNKAPVPVGTLPLYQAVAEAADRYGSALDMKVDDLFEVIERQAADGVDFIAVHCGMTVDVVERARREKRLDPLVSHGGSHLIGWMLHNERENPLYEHFDRLLDLARKYDVTLSFADGMRPGCLVDALDGAQVHELVILGELTAAARSAGVQVMVKGPGHVSLDKLHATVVLQKSLCKGAPYFVFGPLVTDTSIGYDHISAAIGGAITTWAGADFICYVTPAEHIGLPDKGEVREGVIAARIAAHAGDIAKRLAGADSWDRELSVARKKLDWKRQIEMSVDPAKAAYVRKTRSSENSTACAMCGKYCAMEIVSKFLGAEKVSC